jgi:hypothetical protein
LGLQSEKTIYYVESYHQTLKILKGELNMYIMRVFYSFVLFICFVTFLSLTLFGQPLDNGGVKTNNNVEYLQSFFGNKIDFSDEKFRSFVDHVSDIRSIKYLDELGNKKLSQQVQYILGGRIKTYLKEKAQRWTEKVGQESGGNKVYIRYNKYDCSQ